MKKSREKIETWIEELWGEDSGIILMDGMDSAFIGIEESSTVLQAVYDIELILKELQAQGMTREDAKDYFEFNISTGYVGEQTPILFTSFKGK